MTGAAPRGVGASTPRLEAIEKARGAAVYAGDMTLPGMAHGALVLSEAVHARIVSIDVAAARRAPGVRAVLTGADLPDIRTGLLIHDETPLARDRVRYAGEPVAAVAADTEAQARAAARLVKVRYAPLPAVLDMDAAARADAPVLHPEFDAYAAFVDTRLRRRANAICESRISHGDLEAALAASDLVIESVYETQAQQHAYLEPASALAAFDPLGKLTVWSSTQSVSRAQAYLAQALGLPMAKVRAVAPRIGGGFGGKSEPQTQIIAAHLARASGRPVRVTLTRAEDMTAMRSRHPARIRLRTGVTRDGRLLAREASVEIDGGAYADDSPVILNVMLFFCTGPYRIEAVRAEGAAYYTNKLRAAAMRGFGNPQITFAVESHMDEIAAALDLDPADLRLRNLIEVGDRWLGGQPIRSSGLRACVEAALDASGWRARPRGGETTADGRRRGLGLGLCCHTSAFMGTGAFIRLLDDGSVALNTGSVDLGQGGDTVMAQMCAEALGLDLGQVNVAAPDTDASPYNSGTNASRSTHMVGRAIGLAAGQVRDQLFARASLLLGVPATALELRPGGLVGISGANAAISFRDLAGFALNAAAGGGPVQAAASVMQNEPLDPAHTQSEGMLSFDTVGAFTFGAQVVETEVDAETGLARVSRAWLAHDVGRAINPLAVEGQIEGGFVQGLGYALFEELVWRDGRLQNPGFSGYKIPSTLEAPDVMRPIIIEEPDPGHPFGAKGVGEPPLIAAPGAIANAVADALGVRIRRLPMTPGRVLDALDAREPPSPPTSPAI